MIEAERVYLTASALVAGSPMIDARRALLVATKIVKLVEEVEVLKMRIEIEAKGEIEADEEAD